MPETLISTGADLTTWRSRLGWSTQRAADELRILPPSLRNLEAGRKQPSPALLRLAEVLEQLERAPALAITTKVNPTSARKPRTKKPVPVEPTDPFEAAAARVFRRQMPAEALALLRAAVERRLAGYVGGVHGGPAVGEDLVAWRQRERAWHAAKGGEIGASLDTVAGLVIDHLAA